MAGAVNYDTAAEQLIESCSWLPASPSQLDIVLYGCLHTGTMTSKLRRTLGYLYAQLRRSCGVHYDLSPSCLENLSGMSMHQLRTLHSQVRGYATTASLKQKRADYTRIADTVFNIMVFKQTGIQSCIVPVSSKHIK